MQNMDLDILQWFQKFQMPWLDHFANFLSFTAEEIFVMLIVTYLIWCYDKKIGYRLGFYILFSVSINYLLKNIFALPRPIGITGVVSKRLDTAYGYSFPSGHTQNATVLWFFLMNNFRKKWLYLLGVVMIILVAFSRVYLGVHWPSDVLAGVIFALMSLGAAVFFYENMMKHTLWPVLCSLIPTIILLVFYASPTVIHLAGLFCGYLLAYLLDARKLDLVVASGKIEKVSKYLIGWLSGIAIYIGGEYLLSAYLWSEIVLYFGLMMWLLIAFPYLWMRLVRHL